MPVQFLDDDMADILRKEFLGSETIKEHAAEIMDLIGRSNQQPQRGGSEDHTERHAAFEDFAAREAAASGEDARYLTRPSGSLYAPLAIQLHYPTYNSQTCISGECAEPTNPCTRLLLRKGLTPPSVFWFEKWFRREEVPLNRNVLPQNNYSEELKSLHKAFSEWRWDQTSASVIIIFGEAVRKAFRKRFSMAQEISWVYQDPSVPGCKFLHSNIPSQI